MKKKILFIMPHFTCGGVESALLSLLDVIDREKYEISLLLLLEAGEFIERIPKDIKILRIQIPEKEQGVFLGKKNQLKNYLKRGKFIKAFTSLIYNSKTKITSNRLELVNYFSRISDTIPTLEGEYDIAVDYFGYVNFTTFYLSEKVNAKIKVSWLHTVFSNINPQPFLPYYKKMDRIFAVSQMVKDDFETVFPMLDNVEVFYNIIDPESIREKSLTEKGFDDDYKGLRILTVGRISPEKGQDLAINALKRLIADEFDVRWYFIGGGEEQHIDEISSVLTEQEKQEHLCFLGMKDNPFPYMRQCDIYVQPSYVEGYCTTTNEARIVNCPIVTTDVSGAREQFVNEQTALIVDISEDGIYQGVKRLIEHPEMRKTLKENLKTLDFGASKELKKLFGLIQQ